MKVFVTVGTTKFGALTAEFEKDEVLQALISLGCKRLTIQYGSGKPLSSRTISTLDGSSSYRQMELVAYDYKPSLADDMAAADLIIGHAGAGTILEALELGKKLIVVTNDGLMDNHQSELADKMMSLNHAIACTPSTLSRTLARTRTFAWRAYTKGNAAIIGKYIQSQMDGNQAQGLHWTFYVFATLLAAGAAYACATTSVSLPWM